MVRGAWAAVLSILLAATSARAAPTLERYGAWGEKNMYGKITTGVIRSTVIIDPAGKVAHHYRKVSAKGHAESVQAKLKELQA